MPRIPTAFQTPVFSRLVSWNLSQQQHALKPQFIRNAVVTLGMPPVTEFSGMALSLPFIDFRIQSRQVKLNPFSSKTILLGAFFSYDITIAMLVSLKTDINVNSHKAVGLNMNSNAYTFSFEIFA